MRQRRSRETRAMNIETVRKLPRENVQSSKARNIIGGGREGKTNLCRFFVGWPVFRLS